MVRKINLVPVLVPGKEVFYRFAEVPAFLFSMLNQQVDSDEDRVSRAGDFT